MASSNNDAGRIDRVGPTARPPGRAVMRQTWSRLLFLHWEVEPDCLRRLIPAPLELDLFEGRAFIGLVPFTMSGVRPVFAPAAPWLSKFHETNVRTYVHLAGRDPGVWFFSLDAANPVAVWLARRLFHLPYHHARMSLAERPDGTTRYASERIGPGPVPAECRIEGRPTGPPAPAAVGTLEHFLAERYLLYAASPKRLFRGQVHHAAYPLQAAECLDCEENLLAAAGVERPSTGPIAHYARKVKVEIFPLTRVGVVMDGAVQAV